MYSAHKYMSILLYLGAAAAVAAAAVAAAEGGFYQDSVFLFYSDMNVQSHQLLENEDEP